LSQIFSGFLAGFWGVFAGFLAIPIEDFWQIFGTILVYFIAHLVSFYRYARAKHG
jgi:hypothetical protein